MNKFINDLIQEGEGQQIEFKLVADIDAIGKTICGFLNSGGGQLIVGLKNNGEVVGVKDAEKIEKNLYQHLIKNIVPEAPITIATEIIDDKKILLVKVWPGSKQPYIFQGSIFSRVGEKTVQATSQEISALIHNRQLSELQWERQISLGIELDDLDIDEIKKTIAQIRKTERAKDLSDDVVEFLSDYGLYNNGKITNAALVLFGKKPSKQLPQCRVRLTVFSTDKIGSTFDYDKVLEGHLFKNVNDILQFFETSIGLFSKFDDKSWQRIDKPRYPIPALREGVLNALIHRDYSNISGNVFIGIYPEKIEITNYGEFPKALTISDLKKNHLSLPRNPDIAHICFLRGWIEKIGRGTLKIVAECKSAGLKEPKWISQAGVITLTFFGPQSQAKQIERGELNERQLKLLSLLKPGEIVTVSEYLEKTGINLTDRSARNDLSLLIDGGWFVKQGKGRSTVYRRTDKDGT